MIRNEFLIDLIVWNIGVVFSDSDLWKMCTHFDFETNVKPLTMSEK